MLSRLKIWPFRTDEAKLTVVVIEGTQATTLWWQYGSHGDTWQPAVVTVGRMPQDFSITFEGFRTFNHPGHVAIDDITFTNCSLPGNSVRPGLLLKRFYSRPGFTEVSFPPQSLSPCVPTPCSGATTACVWSPSACATTAMTVETAPTRTTVVRFRNGRESNVT